MDSRRLDPLPNEVRVDSFFGPLIAFLFTVFWMIVGWRAMLAHERLAQATETIARRTRD